MIKLGQARQNLIKLIKIVLQPFLCDELEHNPPRFFISVIHYQNMTTTTDDKTTRGEKLSMLQIGHHNLILWAVEDSLRE